MCGHLCLGVRTYHHDDHRQGVHIGFCCNLFLFRTQFAKVVFWGPVAGYVTTGVANVEAGVSVFVDENVRLGWAYVS